MVTNASLSARVSMDASRRELPRLQLLLRLVLVFAFYLAAGKLGLSVPFTSGNVSPIWPASGVALASVLLWGYEVWPAITLAAFLVNFFSPVSATASLGIALGNTSSALFGGYLLRRFASFQPSLARMRDVLGLVILAAVVSPIVAASIGITTLFLTHMHAWSDFSSAWRVWWLGDAMGVLIVTPLFLTGRELVSSLRSSRLTEFVLLGAGLFATCAAIFGGRTGFGVQDDVLAFVAFPFVIWAAIRFRVAGVAMASFLIAVIAVWGTAQGNGPFVKHDPLGNVALLQLFIAVTSMTGLILAGVIEERERAITERKRAEESLRELSGRLLQTQDEERRRIARELHDSAGQILAALSMNLTPLEPEANKISPSAAKAITESLGLVNELSKELRTISHLLHPPLLDEVGLSSGLRSYLEGFAERSKISIDLDIPDDFGRLSRDLETAIFRIVQECLTNIHRHSGSPVGKIRISRSNGEVRLQVEDLGKGIPPEKRSAINSAGGGGVGIRGMRERVRQLGGNLEISSNGNKNGKKKGTTIVARLPVVRVSSTVVS